MELPSGIERELVRYLCLELGESPRSKSSVKAEDLVYEGRFVTGGIPTHFWREGSRRNLWATVGEVEGTPCLGMTSESPTLTEPIAEYQKLRIGDHSGKFNVELPLESDGNGGYLLRDFVEVKLPRKEVVRVLAEAYTKEEPVALVVSVEQGDKSVYVRAAHRVELAYTTESGRELYLSLGPEA